MLGTLGSFLKEATRSDESLFFRFLLSPPALPSPRLELEDAGTDWSAEMSLDPLSDLDGLDEENLRWWPLTMTGLEVALGAAAVREATRPPAGAEATTRRTEDGSMIVSTRVPLVQEMGRGTVWKRGPGRMMVRSFITTFSTQTVKRLAARSEATALRRCGLRHQR